MNVELTPERLQSIAVDCVTKFMNKQASLNEAIAKEAQFLELNSDQTKRVIEATNTIAYLRQLEKAADRTFEFPVADFGQVMGQMCLPEMNKSASEKEEDEDKDEDKKDKKKDSGDHEYRGDKKEDKDEKSERTFPWSKKEDKEDKKSEDKDEAKEQEKVAMVTRECFRAKSNLEKIACDKVGLHLRLSAAASILHKDPLGLEKLAEVVEEEDYFATLALCGLEKRASESLVFTDKELAPAREVYGLYKEARELVATEKELEEFVKKAESFFFEKQAVLAAMAGGVTRLAGAAIGGVVKPIGRVLGKSLGGAAANTGNAMGAGIRNTFSANPTKGFTGHAFDKGFTKMDGARKVVDNKAAVKHFDMLKRTKGLDAAKSHFGNTSPNWLAHRDGTGKLFDAATATSIAGGAKHMYSARDELIPPKY